MPELTTAEWIERSKRRHELCLNWQSDGAVALAMHAPTGVGRDWTRWFSDPQAMLDYELAILKAKSPSCGKGLVYDGTHSGRLIEGNGETAALLLQNGIQVLTEEEI